MTSKERVIRTITFQQPDRIPTDLWLLPATRTLRGPAIEEILAKHPTDISSVDYRDPLADERHFKKGTYTDVWGITWFNLQDGIHPEAKDYPLGDWSALRSYKTPSDRIDEDGWDYVDDSIRQNADRFILGPGGNPFERMQFMRGTENLFIDLIEDVPEVHTLLDMVVEHYAKIVRKSASCGVDAITFADDWGSQTSLLIPPRIWRSFFKPAYKYLFDIARSAGKYVFFHSDGYIMEIYGDLIEIGVSAVNSQLWCMGVESVARDWAGKITFWGEISRQDTMPHGTPNDVRAAADVMKKHLFVNGGGLIGQSEAGPDVPIENVEALLTAWGH